MKSAFFRWLPLLIPRSTLIRLLLALLAGLVSQPIWADGKVFPPVATPVEVTIPDQRALVSWSNGVERLIIETRLAGSGTNFAWVVPVPSRPQVEPATSGVFPTLEHLLQPSVIHAPTAWWLLGLFVGALAFLLLTVRPSGRLRLGDVVGAAVMGISVGGVGQGEWAPMGLAAFLIISLVVLRRVRRQGLRIWDVLILFFIAFILAGLFLPSLAKASAKGGANGTVGGITILDRQWAGVYETTTLTGRDGRSLREWFQREGYSFYPSAVPVFEEYLRDGWVFVASKVRRDVAVGTNSLPPLSFTFATPQPVYPLRLTGVDNGNLDVELFVFGPERARADGFSVRTCRPVSRPPADLDRASWYPERFTLPLLHPGLQSAVGDTLYVTRLRATLTPSQMRQDAQLHWDGFEERQEVLYSARGAFTTAANIVMGVAAVASLALILVPNWRRRSAPVAGPVFTVGALLTTAVIGLVYLWLPVVPVTLQRGRDWNFYSRGPYTSPHQWAVQMAIAEGEFSTNQPVTVDAVREALRNYLPFHLEQEKRFRPLHSLREEDSPGNYTLRAHERGVDLLLYNGWGGVTEIPIPP